MSVTVTPSRFVNRGTEAPPTEVAPTPEAPSRFVGRGGEERARTEQAIRGAFEEPPRRTTLEPPELKIHERPLEFLRSLFHDGLEVLGAAGEITTLPYEAFLSGIVKKEDKKALLSRVERSFKDHQFRFLGQDIASQVAEDPGKVVDQLVSGEWEKAQKSYPEPLWSMNEALLESTLPIGSLQAGAIPGYPFLFVSAGQLARKTGRDWKTITIGEATWNLQTEHARMHMAIANPIIEALPDYEFPIPVRVPGTTGIKRFEINPQDIAREMAIGSFALTAALPLTITDVLGSLVMSFPLVGPINRALRGGVRLTGRGVRGAGKAARGFKRPPKSPPPEPGGPTIITPPPRVPTPEMGRTQPIAEEPLSYVPPPITKTGAALQADETIIRRAVLQLEERVMEQQAEKRLVQSMLRKAQEKAELRGERVERPSFAAHGEIIKRQKGPGGQQAIELPLDREVLDRLTPAERTQLETEALTFDNLGREALAAKDQAGVESITRQMIIVNERMANLVDELRAKYGPITGPGAAGREEFRLARAQRLTELQEKFLRAEQLVREGETPLYHGLDLHEAAVVAHKGAIEVTELPRHPDDPFVAAFPDLPLLEFPPFHRQDVTRFRRSPAGLIRENVMRFVTTREELGRRGVAIEPSLVRGREVALGLSREKLPRRGIPINAILKVEIDPSIFIGLDELAMSVGRERADQRLLELIARYEDQGIPVVIRPLFMQTQIGEFRPLPPTGPVLQQTLKARKGKPGPIGGRALQPGAEEPIKPLPQLPELPLEAAPAEAMETVTRRKALERMPAEMEKLKKKMERPPELKEPGRVLGGEPAPTAEELGFPKLGSELFATIEDQINKVERSFARENVKTTVDLYRFPFSNLQTILGSIDLGLLRLEALTVDDPMRQKAVAVISKRMAPVIKMLEEALKTHPDRPRGRP